MDLYVFARMGSCIGQLRIGAIDIFQAVMLFMRRIYDFSKPFFSNLYPKPINYGNKSLLKKYVLIYASL